MTLTPIISGFPINFGTASRYSWIPIKTDLPDRPLFAQASYITNFSDLVVSLSTPSIDIGKVEIIDRESGLRCDVSQVSYQGDLYNSLHVVAQNLQPIYDTVSIADKQQNNVAVFPQTSSLYVHITNYESLTSIGKDIVSLLEVLTSQEVRFSELSVSVLNPVTAVDVLNQLTGINVLNPVTAIDILNVLDISGNIIIANPVTAVEVLNQLSAFTVLNPITAVEVLNQLSAFTVLNPATAIDILNVLDVSGNITIANPVTAVEVLNQLTGINVLNEVPMYAVQTLPISGLVSVANPVTGIHILNSVPLKDINDNNVSVTASTSSLNVNVTNPVVTTITGSNVPVTFAPSANFDAFNRLRTSTPFTLFDSSHRYKDNSLWASLTAVGGTCTFNQNQGLVELTVSGLSGSTVVRETTKVFSYQPGKSLEVLNTFVMAPSAFNVRQRVGYFGQDNGVYFQLDDDVISFVKRSLINGSPVSETVVPLSAWNGDKLDGSGPSKLILDVTKAQIFWMDIEWLGVGTVRCGFVINGQFIVCHSFHHANIISSTYITTASLPLRYEITNKGDTIGSRTLKQICSTVLSEGGYELRGSQQAIQIPVQSPVLFPTANAFYPIISLRLKASPNRLDAVVIPTSLSILGKGNGINYNWQLRAAGTTSGGSWVTTEDSAVEYNLTGSEYSGGKILASGFLNSSNQGSPNMEVLKESLFKFQLERNSFTNTPYEISVVVATDTSNGSGILASINWEEITR